MLQLKYEYSRIIRRNGKIEEKSKDIIAREEEFIDAVNDGAPHKVKLLTNKLDIKLDKLDDRVVDSIKNIKIVYEIKSGGCLIFRGMITKMELFGSDPKSLYMLNQELAARVYTAPSLVL